MSNASKLDSCTANGVEKEWTNKGKAIQKIATETLCKKRKFRTRLGL